MANTIKLFLLSLAISIATLAFGNLARHPSVTEPLESLALYGLFKYPSSTIAAQGKPNYSHALKLTTRGDLRNAMAQHHTRYMDVSGVVRSIDLSRIVVSNHVKSHAVIAALYDAENMSAPARYLLSCKGIVILYEYFATEHASLQHHSIIGNSYRICSAFSWPILNLNLPFMNYFVFVYVVAIISSWIVRATENIIYTIKISSIEIALKCFIVICPTMFILNSTFFFWYVLMTRADLNFLSSLFVTQSSKSIVLILLIAYLLSVLGLSHATVWYSALRHGLYRPRRAGRCANCRYALPAAVPASVPTEGPAASPTAESAAGPCPECGWDRVSVPKRAWRNLRRFAFCAFALTVFFYLGPLWISWLAVIL